MAIPIALLVLFAQRRVAAGLTGGSPKGPDRWGGLRARWPRFSWRG
ncbi:MAG TPA: hypothetical protein VNN74_08595 [Candidatus Micrarchaeia archaeon]|nr:hypothetical protein [Candidatus Micrarchaeia archaeon]